MTLTKELQNLEREQSRLVRLCQYLEKKHNGHYDDYIEKIGCVIGTIEDVLNIDGF